MAAGLNFAFEREEMSFYVNLLVSGLRLDNLPLSTRSVRGLALPYDDGGFYGEIELGENNFLMMDFEAPSLISFGLYKRGDPGQKPQVLFRESIGRPVERAGGPELLKLSRIKVALEMSTALSTRLSDTNQKSLSPELKLKSRAIVLSMELENHIEAVEQKLARKEPKYGGAFLALVAWSLFLLWVD